MSVIEIFRAGRHRSMAGVDHEFTTEDLDMAAKTYAPSRHEAPLVIGHPQTNSPAYGWVSRLFRQGSSLYAEVTHASEQLMQWVREGRYKKISASFYQPNAAGNPVPGALYLRHVGFLGATPPAVKGMADPAFSEFSDGFLCFGASENDIPACFHEAPEVGGNDAPPGFSFDAGRLALHRRILAHRQACPGLSYGQAAALVCR